MSVDTLKSLLNKFAAGRNSRRTNARLKSATQATEALESRALLTLIGTNAIVSNTIQTAAGTNGVEQSFGPTGTTVVVDDSTDPEFASFSGAYDIDIDANTIAMRFNASGASISVPPGRVADGTFDRYYFAFDLAANESIAAASASANATLQPNVTVNGNVVVVEIAPGMQVGPGFDALINVNILRTGTVITGRKFHDVNNDGDRDFSENYLNGWTLELRDIDAEVIVPGKTVTVSSTVQEAEGSEQSSGTPASATISEADNTGEFISFNGLYNIDVDADSLTMNFNLAAGAATPTSPVPAGAFQRYRFEFALTSEELITSARLNDPNSIYVSDVSIEGDNVLVVEIGADKVIGAGANFQIDFVIRDKPIATTTTQSIDLNGNGSIEPETETGVYAFTNVPAGTFVVQEVIPEGWHQTLPNHPNTVTAFELDSEREFTSTGNHFLNWGGLNEKWFFGLATPGSNTTSGSWYYITPDGSIFQWNGSPQTALTGTQIATLDSSYYEDPSLVYNAPSPRQYIADVDVANPTTFRGLDFGNRLAATDFTVTTDQETNEATMSWDAAEGATYDVWISDIAAGRQIQYIPDLDGDQIPLITQLPDRRYRVWIRTNSMGASSPWSTPQEFEFFRDAVNLITSNRATTIDATPTIEWVPLAGASSYDFRVTNGEQVVYLQNDVTSLSHRVANPLQFGVDYRVAVRANFADGSQTAWDAGLPIRIDGRAIASVTGNVVSWSPVPAATEYEIWVNSFDTDGVLVQSQIVSATVVDQTTYTLPNVARGNYAVWVRAIRSEDDGRYLSFWSPRVNFFVTANEQSNEGVENLLALDSVVTALRPEVSDDVTKVDEVQTAEDVVSQSDDVSSRVTEETDEITAIMAELSSSDLLQNVTL